MTSSIPKKILEDIISNRKSYRKSKIVETTPQMRGKVPSFDFASLYPTTMRTFSMGSNKSVKRKLKIKEVIDDISRS